MTEKRGGIGHRVGPLTRGDSFSSALHNNGFKLITCDSFEKIYGFPTMFELIEDIQNAGESQCSLNYRPLHKDMLMAAAGIYQAMYGDEYGIQGRDPRPFYGPSVVLSNLGKCYQYNRPIGGWIHDKATFRTTNFIGWKASQSQEKYIKERGAVPKGIQQRKPPCGKN